MLSSLLVTSFRCSAQRMKATNNNHKRGNVTGKDSKTSAKIEWHDQCLGARESGLGQVTIGRIDELGAMMGLSPPDVLAVSVNNLYHHILKGETIA